MSAVSDALKLIKDEEVEYVDIRFTDPKGKLQHVTLVADLVDEDFFERRASTRGNCWRRCRGW